ncbi:hypothetical protein ABZ825_42620 [Streptomyces tauricus]|uniref:hypothetical protein n=1 Tax=Streptomyces tauricus TaxID=68274 RepID=UPI0033DD504B
MAEQDGEDLMFAIGGIAEDDRALGSCAFQRIQTIPLGQHLLLLQGGINIASGLSLQLWKRLAAGRPADRAAG